MPGEKIRCASSNSVSLPALDPKPGRVIEFVMGWARDAYAGELGARILTMRTGPCEGLLATHARYRSKGWRACMTRYCQSREELMSSYLIRWQFKDATVKALVDSPQNRTASARVLIEGFGGKLLSYYLALGEYDGLGICEFPDTVSVAACSMKAAATGAFARFETMALLTAAEAEEAMKKAKRATVDYTAPNADHAEVARSFRDHVHRRTGKISHV